MHLQSYIDALLEELRGPRDKSAESTIRAELARLNVAAPTAKEIKAETSRAQAQQATQETPEAE